MLNHVETQVELLGESPAVVIMFDVDAVCAIGSISIDMRMSFVSLPLKSYNAGDSTHG